MNKLVIIDGNAILHRAYHAYPPLTNNKGEVINAVYGFFSMLFSIITDQKPEYLAVCFDRAAPTFRQSMFAGYQQGRPSLPDDFVPQIALVHEFLEKLNVAVFELDGYEADDLIGTIATLAVQSSVFSSQLSASGQSVVGSSVKKHKNRKSKDSNLKTENREPITEVVIVTGDRDMLQLVNGKVKVLMPLLGITKTALFGAKEVEEKYGVKPSQFIDYKALIGDASDGYPGVSGIGPKGASNLLKEYGTFENLYQNIPNLPEKIGLKLATDAEQAALAKKLATIVTDVPIQFDIQKCKSSDFDPKALHAAFVDQGFNTLTKRLDSIFGIEAASNAAAADETQPSHEASAGNAKETEETRIDPSAGSGQGKKESDQLELL